jgi:hypothetical protein
MFVTVHFQKDKRLRKIAYGVCILIFLIGVCLSTGWAQQANGPKMVLPEKLHDAQEVKEGEIVKHSFPVLNKGDQPLEIKRVQPG